MQQTVSDFSRCKGKRIAAAVQVYQSIKARWIFIAATLPTVGLPAACFTTLKVRFSWIQTGFSIWH
jgi:hypothetical protein